MARRSVTTTSTSSHGSFQERGSSTSESITKKFLDEALRDEILAGLQGFMTDEEIAAYAENKLRPILNAEIEESQKNFDTTKLSKEQEIENLAAQLTKAIGQQEAAYGKSVADVETAALGRGMGRSSYALQNVANQGKRYAEAVQGLTDENTRLTDQIQKQISQAAQQNQATQGRLNTDYASRLAAEIQNLIDTRRHEQNDYYMSATSAALGTKQTGQTQSESSGTNESSSFSTSETVSGGGGSGGGSRGGRRDSIVSLKMPGESIKVQGYDYDHRKDVNPGITFDSSRFTANA